MDINTAVQALGALSQETRLRAFRLLVRRGGAGLPAGDIARSLKIPHNTLSSHTAILVKAGLLKARRTGRSIIYSIDFDGTQKLLSYLMEDCCQGHRDMCAPALESVLPACCETPNAKRRKP